MVEILLYIFLGLLAFILGFMFSAYLSNQCLKSVKRSIYLMGFHDGSLGKRANDKNVEHM